MKLGGNNSNFTNCPYPDCEDYIEVTNDLLYEPFVECSSMHKFCVKCKELGWHANGVCTDV